MHAITLLRLSKQKNSLMELLKQKLIDKASANIILREITKDQSLWLDGKKTAGKFAAEVKDNLQLDKSSHVSIENSNLIIKAITSDQLIKSFSLPRKVHGVMFTQTSAGQGYGMHIDNAYMSSGRSDLSFTLFLNDPNEYEGGELAIQTMQSIERIKLPQGYILLYPSTSLHSVEEVKVGTRHVCVGWIQSYICNSEDRNLLFGLDAGAKGILAKYGRSPELDLIFQAYGNLQRRLGR